jgi:hypothetical protein
MDDHEAKDELIETKEDEEHEGGSESGKKSKKEKGKKEKKEKKKKKEKKATLRKRSKSHSAPEPTKSSESDDKSFDVRSTLPQEHLEILDEMRKKADPLLTTEREKKWCSDMCLIRYLKARDFDIKKALVLLEGTLEWRRYSLRCMILEC